MFAIMKKAKAKAAEIKKEELDAVLKAKREQAIDDDTAEVENEVEEKPKRKGARNNSKNAKVRECLT